MAQLLIGPLLRYVSDRAATVWVEVDGPASVEVRAGEVTATERTFAVAGHHYAVVALRSLKPGSSTPYDVRLDGNLVWPLAGSGQPPSRIRTLQPSGQVRLLVGSCREPPGRWRGPRPALEPDVLEAYARRMASQAHEQWPDALFMAGDQIYADDTSPAVRKFIRARRDVSRPPHEEVADFEEYTQLYRESWNEPNVRWLLSTLPTFMIFDDHDVRDDWNTSHAWRMDMQATGWWDARIAGALMSYWIYQHIGNLSPDELAADATYRALRAADDGQDILREFARAADREADGAKGYQWSYRRDLGGVRVLVLDSRCGRILADENRSMLSEAEFGWAEQQTEDGNFDHLVVGTSMPWLLPRALHDLESWDEALAAGAHGKRLARFGEWLRRAVDLEHWAAFRVSFDRLARLFGRIGRGEDGSLEPATICVLSGDVHHTYVSEVEFGKATPSRVFQITCSPIYNTIPRVMRVVFRVGWSHSAERFMAFLARRAGVPRLPIRWHHPTGPHFGNILALLVFDGRSASLVLERSTRPPLLVAAEDPEAAKPGLAVVTELSLTGERPG